jgi:hypothetical protein
MHLAAVFEVTCRNKSLSLLRSDQDGLLALMCDSNDRMDEPRSRH